MQKPVEYFEKYFDDKILPAKLEKKHDQMRQDSRLDTLSHSVHKCSIIFLVHLQWKLGKVNQV